MTYLCPAGYYRFDKQHVQWIEDSIQHFDAYCRKGCDEASDCNGNLNCNFRTHQCSEEIECDEDGDCNSGTCSEQQTCKAPEFIPGDSCAHAIEPDHYPYQLTGTDFAADYTSQWSGGSECVGNNSATASEVFIKLDVQPGEIVHVAETRNVDVVISFIKSCDATSCEKSSDLGTNESSGLTYNATAHETLCVVVESWYADQNANKPYNIVVNKRIPHCGDGVVDEKLEEACDDGHTDPDDGCKRLPDHRRLALHRRKQLPMPSDHLRRRDHRRRREMRHAWHRK